MPRGRSENMPYKYFPDRGSPSDMKLGGSLMVCLKVGQVGEQEGGGTGGKGDE